MTPLDEQVRRRIIGHWLHKADQDLRAAESLLKEEPPLLYPSCFHSQQAAEKYLKAYLVWKAVNFSKTHDIQEILELVESANPPLAQSLQGAIVLTDYAVDVRYPGDMPEPDVSEARTALALAVKVRDEVKGALPPL